MIDTNNDINTSLDSNNDNATTTAILSDNNAELLSSKNVLRSKYCERNKKSLSICISANVIFYPNTFELSDSDVLIILKQIAKNSSLYIISNCKTSDEIMKLNDVLAVYGLFDSGLLPHRVLASSTIPGKIAMMRQLDPSLYIDNQIDVVKPLEQFISVALIGDKYLTLKASTIFAETLSKLFK